jgi:hypothetical protein
LYRLIGLRPEDIALVTNRNVIAVGAPEPAWLRRSAEYARELPLLMAEQRTAREKDAAERRGIVARLRLVLALGRA